MLCKIWRFQVIFLILKIHIFFKDGEISVFHREIRLVAVSQGEVFIFLDFIQDSFLCRRMFISLILSFNIMFRNSFKFIPLVKIIFPKDFMQCRVCYCRYDKYFIIFLGGSWCVIYLWKFCVFGFVLQILILCNGIYRLYCRRVIRHLQSWLVGSSSLALGETRYP